VDRFSPEASSSMVKSLSVPHETEDQDLLNTGNDESDDTIHIILPIHPLVSPRSKRTSSLTGSLTHSNTYTHTHTQTHLLSRTRMSEHHRESEEKASSSSLDRKTLLLSSIRRAPLLRDIKHLHFRSFTSRKQASSATTTTSATSSSVTVHTCTSSSAGASSSTSKLV
jgi:hypothetical protein